MTRSRPRWWPRSLWPGTSRPEPPGELPAAPPGREGEGPAPIVSFLRALTAAFGAEAASVHRLERDRSTWVLEHRVGEETSAPVEELGAAGHPLTWCLREELLIQSEAEELLGVRASGWALAGAVPGADRALVLFFGGPPPSGARKGLEAAVEHVSALHEADTL